MFCDNSWQSAGYRSTAELDTYRQDYDRHLRRHHGAASFVNLSDAEGKHEALSADLDKLRQLQKEYLWE